MNNSRRSTNRRANEGADCTPYTITLSADERTVMLDVRHRRVQTGHLSSSRQATDLARALLVEAAHVRAAAARLDHASSVRFATVVTTVDERDAIIDARHAERQSLAPRRAAVQALNEASRAAGWFEQCPMPAVTGPALPVIGLRAIRTVVAADEAGLNRARGLRAVAETLYEGYRFCKMVANRFQTAADNLVRPAAPVARPALTATIVDIDAAVQVEKARRSDDAWREAQKLVEAMFSSDYALPAVDMTAAAATVARLLAAMPDAVTIDPREAAFETARREWAAMSAAVR